MKSRFTLHIVLAVIVSTLHCAAAEPGNVIRVLIVGDSTVREYAPPRPDRGWGQYIEERFQTNTVKVFNRAQAGRSTKTFISQGWWRKGLAEKPNYVLIQFGHNDAHAPDKPEATDAATDFQDYLRRYIDESRAVGATPILVTPMVQRTFDAGGRLQDGLQRYAEAMKAVGAEKKVAVIDLHAASKRLVEELGPEKSAAMANKKGDPTHFNERGARAMADLVMRELPTVEPKLKAYLKAGDGGVADSGPKFHNGTLTEHARWLDTNGNLINAHDGGIIFADGKYHWYGLELRPKSVKEGGQKTTTGVVMYASTNLYDWTYEGVILECSTDPKSPLYGPMRFERPKIIYNERTQQYVLWCHYVRRPGDHTEKPGAGEAGIASCSTVNGKYTFHGTVRPVDDRGLVRDSTLFQDDDGSAYFIYDRDIRIPGPDFGRVLHIVKLSDDYLKPTTNYFKMDVAAGREAPVMIKRDGRCFLITSGLTGWNFNRAKYFTATNIFGPYTDMGDPCVGESTDTTFNSQGTHAFPVQGRPGEFIFICERHNQACMTDSSFIFLPVYFPTPDTLQLRYLPEWQWESWLDGK